MRQLQYATHRGGRVAGLPQPRRAASTCSSQVDVGLQRHAFAEHAALVSLNASRRRSSRSHWLYKRNWNIDPCVSCGCAVPRVEHRQIGHR